MCGPFQRNVVHFPWSPLQISRCKALSPEVANEHKRSLEEI